MKLIFKKLLIILIIISVTPVFGILSKADFSKDGLSISGDPSSKSGATWTYKSTDNGIAYDISGHIIKPVGEGVFPAVILSHGKGGSASQIAQNIGSKMVEWGVVVISVNYTHAREPLGESTPGNWGANDDNILRGLKCIEILESLPYVNKNKIAAHGHSMGAFMTAALVGTAPDKFVVASHTAGGLSIEDRNISYSTKLSQAKNINIPYQIHHGVLDKVVNISQDRELYKLLKNSDIDAQMIEYEDLDHSNISSNPQVIDAIKKWYETHNFFNNKIEIKLQINKTYGYLNGKKIIPDVPAKLVGERTFLPVRFIGALLNQDTKWDDITQTASIGTVKIVIGDNFIYINNEKNQLTLLHLLKMEEQCYLLELWQRHLICKFYGMRQLQLLFLISNYFYFK